MHQNLKLKPACRVKLEPELERIAAHWTARQRLMAAARFARWSHQLRVADLILNPGRRAAFHGQRAKLISVLGSKQS